MIDKLKEFTEIEYRELESFAQPAKKCQLASHKMVHCLPSRNRAKESSVNTKNRTKKWNILIESTK